MNFVLLRNRTLATTSGHVIEFVKGVPTHVPADAYADAQAIGAIPEDELPENEVVEADEITDPEARKAAVYAAFDALVLRNGREDFTAAGSPTPKALNTLLGWALSSKERNLSWNQYRADKGTPE